MTVVLFKKKSNGLFNGPLYLLTFLIPFKYTKIVKKLKILSAIYYMYILFYLQKITIDLHFVFF